MFTGLWRYSKLQWRGNLRLFEDQCTHLKEITLLYWTMSIFGQEKTTDTVTNARGFAWRKVKVETPFAVVGGWFAGNSTSFWGMARGIFLNNIFECADVEWVFHFGKMGENCRVNTSRIYTDSANFLSIKQSSNQFDVWVNCPVTVVTALFSSFFVVMYWI